MSNDVVTEKCNTEKEERIVSQNEKCDAEEQQQIISQLEYIKELSILKYEEEQRRTKSLIQQSSQMQASFSFVIVAVFMAVAILLEYRGGLSLKLFFVPVVLIIVLLFISLIFASLVQYRYTRKVLLDIKDINNRIIDSENWKKFTCREYQLRDWIDTIADVQDSESTLNNRRVKQIRQSMRFLWGAIASVIIFIIVLIIII